MTSTQLVQHTSTKARADVAIANDAARSGNIYGTNELLKNQGFRGGDLLLTSDWTAADILFEVSLDDDTYYFARDNEGTAYRISGIATSDGGSYSLPAGLYTKGAYPFMRLVSVTAETETPANQGGARTMTMLFVN